MLHHTFLDVSEYDIFRDCVKEIAKDSGGGKFTSKIGKARPKLEKRVEHILTVPMYDTVSLEVTEQRAAAGLELINSFRTPTFISIARMEQVGMIYGSTCLYV